MAKHTDIQDSLVAAVADAIDGRHLIPKSAGVVVGVSGGCDSVALLTILRELADHPDRQYRLIVAHLNHHLRAEAGQDAQFVQQLASDSALPCHIGDSDVAQLAEQLGQGIEQAGRMARYEFLRQVAIKENANIVAVAHHADDNVETILYRIVRGTHLHGLSGMAASRPLTGENTNVTLIRPMLDIRRNQIEEFCQVRGLAFRSDASNTDVKFRRNFIRHDLLSLLRERLNPQVDQAILRLAKAAEMTDDFVSAQAATALQQARLSQSDGKLILSIPALLALHPAVVMTAIRLAMEQFGVPMRSIGMERINDVQAMLGDKGQTCLNLPGRCTVRVDGESLVFCRTTDNNEPDETGIEICEQVLQCPGLTKLSDGTEITVEIGPFDLSLDHNADEFRRHCQQGQQSRSPLTANQHITRLELLDADKVALPLICRPRQHGDTLWPLGCSGRQSVSDFLTNLKLPPTQRNQAYWPKCICDQKGIVCLSPLRIDQRVKVTAETRNVIRLHMAT